MPEPDPLADDLERQFLPLQVLARHEQLVGTIGKALGIVVGSVAFLAGNNHPPVSSDWVSSSCGQELSRGKSVEISKISMMAFRRRPLPAPQSWKGW